MLPIYEYVCVECGHNFEIQRHIYDDTELVFCPDCCSTLVQRIYRPLPIHYKGHGFYTTDVASEKEFED